MADHCTRMFPRLFLDSNIAEEFKCGCTKATAIVKVVAQELIKEILGRVQSSQYFSVHTDETTDIGVQQQCGVIRFFDNVNGKMR